MIEDIAILERKFVAKTAAKYRSRGYEVEEDCPLDFLPGFRADLVARKGDEVRVIEVKSRTSLAATPRLNELAEILYSKPGWSYDLLLVGEPEKLEAPEGSQPFAEEEIRRRLAEAEEVLEKGSGEAAYLLVWSACEAAIRNLIETAEISIRRVTTASYVLDTAVMHGIISREDHDYLTDMMKFRNAIAHGFDVNGFSDKKVAELIEVVERLLDSEPELA